MKNYIYIFLIFFIFTSYIYADFSPDMQRISDRGKLVVAMFCEDVPPFFMHDREDKFFGFDVELAIDLAQKLGVSLEFNREAKTFDEVVDLVFQKKADVAVSMLSITLERAKKVLFTDSYVTLHQTLLVNRLKAAQLRRGNNPMKFLNCSKSTIGVIAGTSYVGFAKEDFPNAGIISYDTWDSLVNDVLNGSLIALLYDNIEVQNWHKANPDAAIYLQTILRKDRADPLAIAVNWEDRLLYAWLNQYLHKLKIDGVLDRLYQKYIINEDWRNR